MGSPGLISLGLREVKELSRATQLVMVEWDAARPMQPPSPGLRSIGCDFLSYQEPEAFRFLQTGGVCLGGRERGEQGLEGLPYSHALPLGWFLRKALRRGPKHPQIFSAHPLTWRHGRPRGHFTVGGNVGSS